MLKNLSTPSKRMPVQIVNLDESLISVQALQHSYSRLKKCLSNNIFNKFCKFDTHSDKFTPENPYIVFYEHLGEDRTFFLDFFNNLKNIYNKSKVFVIIDDTYEGLLTQEDIEFFENTLDVDDWIVATSNYKLTHKNVIIINIHFYDQYFDNTSISKTTFEFNNNLRSKKFLCMNRQERLHRLLTVDYLLEKGLLNHCYVSCNDTETRLVFQDTDIIKKNMPNLNVSLEELWGHRRYGGIKELKSYNFSKEQRQRLLNILPLSLPDENNITNNPKDMPSADKYFKDSYWALLTERDFFRSDVYEGFTEKTVKCLLHGLPFIVIGLPHTLKHLRDEGFLTFGNFIDESYDSIDDDNKRFAAVKEQIDYLSSLNYNELHLLNQKMKPILEYNFNFLQQKHKNIPSIDLLNRVQLWSGQNHLD
jgi:hypothetical protein